MATLSIKTEVDRSGEIKVRKLREEVGRLSKSELENKAASGGMSAGLGDLVKKAASATAAFYGIREGIDATIVTGFRYNAMIERQTAGMQRMIVATSSDISVKGRQLTLAEKYNLAMEEATKTQEELLRINAITPHTFGETVQIYNAMYVSMKNAGASTADMIELTKKLSIATSSIDFQAVLSGVDGLATGTVEAASVFGRFVASLGLTNDALKATDDPARLILDRLNQMGVAANSMDEAVSNLNNTWQQFMGDLTSDTFLTAKDEIKDMTGWLSELSDQWHSYLLQFRDIDDIKKSNDIQIALIQRQRELAEELNKSTTLMWNRDKKIRRERIDALKEEIDLLEKRLKATTGGGADSLQANQRNEGVISDALKGAKEVLDATGAKIDKINEKYEKQITILKRSGATQAEIDRVALARQKEISDVRDIAARKNKAAKDKALSEEQRRLQKIADAEDALWAHSQKMNADWLRDTLATSDKAMDQWQEYYESIGNMSAAWAIEEARLREEWADFPELENFIELRKKLFEDQSSQPSALQAEVDSLKSHYDQIAFMESDSAQHRIDIVRQAMSEKLIAVQEGNALIEQIEAEHQNNLTDLTEWGLTSRKDFDQMSYEERGLMFSSFLEGMTREAAQQNKAAFRVNQAAAIVNATISTKLGAAKALEFGPIIGPILSGLVLAKGGIQIAAIANQQYQGYETGGVVPGGEQIIRINERGQEAVLNAQATRAIGKEGVDALNSGKGLSQAPVVNLKTVNVLDPAMVGDYLDSSDSDTVFVNKISRNAEQIRSALNA
jgi:ABC-type transporter Mla subunit MlaD